ncbi:MAG: phosphoadenosine phosphosulfate reductase family protein [Candidatus Bathyarchaeum sp.]|nr:MAG: phosphoadenosine phosphosulfate reductase family protein [Candidatus Bathyarchaeum sp.]
MMKLEELVEKSIFILRETKDQFKNPVILWSTGKDSTLTLSLCRDAFFGEVPFPVLHIDTGWKFPVMYKFRDQLAKEWNLDLIEEKSEKAGLMSPSKEIDHKKCCQTLKTDVLKKAIEKHGFDSVVVSIRRDEHYMMNPERVSSPRDKDFRLRFLRKKEEGEGGDAPFESLQNVELWDKLQKDFGEDLHHVMRHPILHWNENDVWRYTEERNIPVNPLYFSSNGKRFLSLGCYPCTVPVESKASTIQEIISEFDTTRINERSGRSQDKEAEQIMRKLKELGYM